VTGISAIVDAMSLMATESAPKAGVGLSVGRAI
jgi:hypothetical protein